MGDETLPHHLARARQHAQQVGRQTGLDGEFAEPQRGQRSPLGGLDQHRVAGGQRGGESPRRDGHREVPRGDDPDHAERLVERHVQPTGHRNLLAGQSFRRTRIELQHVADVPGLPPRRTDRMTGVGDLESGQLLDVGIDDGREIPQCARPLGRGQPGPLPLSRLCAGDRVVDAGGVGELDGAQQLLGRRVDHLTGRHALTFCVFRCPYADEACTRPANNRRSSSRSSGCHCTATTQCSG